MRKISEQKNKPLYNGFFLTGILLEPNVVINMENKKRPPEYLMHLSARTRRWIWRDFHHRRAKIIKNHKIKNTPSILSLSKTNKKIPKNQKSGNFVFSDDFGDRPARRFGVNSFFRNLNYRVKNDMDLKK